MKSFERKAFHIYIVIRNWLTKKPCFYFVLFLSHGGTHIIILMFLTFLCCYLFSKSIQNDGPEYHEICVDLTEASVCGFQINTSINSTSLFNDIGYHQMLGITLTPLLINNDKNTGVIIDGIEYKNASKISVSRYPHKFEWEIRNESDGAIKSKYRKDKYEDCVYEMSTLNDSIIKLVIHKTSPSYTLLNILGEEMFTPQKEKKNPYLYFYIAVIHNIPDSIMLANTSMNIEFGDYNHKEGKITTLSTTPLKINYIFPEPDEMNFSKIVYNTQEKMKKICKNGGVLIQAEDIELTNRRNHLAFIYSILLGAVVAFWIDVLIHLIVKWRNLNLKYRHK